MQIPDFAQLGHKALAAQDLNFLFEHFPGRVDAAQAMANVESFFNTVDSMLDANYVYEALQAASRIDLPVTLRFYFEVMLRHELRVGPRTPAEQRALHYLAHLLELFSRIERIQRVAPEDSAACEYFVDLLREAAEAAGPRVFMVQAHIGNYAIYIAGTQAAWVEFRRRYRGRPVNLEYYCALGAHHYFQASCDRLAYQFKLRPVYQELANRFEYYRGGLQRMAEKHLYH
jgi:hypothetical protein